MKLSPRLFITVLEKAFRNLDWESRGSSIDKKRFSHPLFKNDIVLISENLPKTGTLI